MLVNPMEIATSCPVRKTGKQKKAFRDVVQAYASGLGYAVTLEKGSFGCYNVVIGDPVHAKYLITAHYDTCARLPFPNLITPCNLLPFLLYQLFLVLVIFAAAFIPGVALGMLLNQPGLGGLLAYILVWGILALMLVGPANRHNANDNTSGVVAVLETARTMPAIHRHKVCFVLFDLEEAGLIGSASYRKAHKRETDHQIVLNMDCIGDGDEIVFFPTGKFRKNGQYLSWLRRGCGTFGKKRISLRDKGFSYYPSDQTQFPFGVGIAAFHRSKWAGLYCSRIHTPKDTILEETNVNILRACLTSLISNDAVEEERKS